MATDDVYHSCLSSASTDVKAKACLKAASDRMKECTVTLLEGLWAKFPNAKVGMYIYEVPDVSGECIEEAANFLGGEYCLNKGDGAVSCMVEQLEYWQTFYVDHLQGSYAKPNFTGMNVLGACQEASSVPGASPGNPVRTAGSKSEYTTSCVHPTYNTPTATAVGEQIWKQWLQGELGGGSDAGDDNGNDNHSDGDGAASNNYHMSPLIAIAAATFTAMQLY